MRRALVLGAVCLLGSACIVGEEDLDVSPELAAKKDELKNNHPFGNSFGESASFSTEGEVALDGDFFTDFGTNLRTCGSCHLPSDGWTISAGSAEQVFVASNGDDPIFRVNDGSNSPYADVSSYGARYAAYNMLRTRGLIRVGIGIPAGAEFELAAVEDPYGYASAAELSLFRRPLPSTNLAFVPAVMWDGRVNAGNVHDSLIEQSNGATLGHAQAAAPLSGAQRAAIVAFETALTTAQDTVNGAGKLDKHGGNGTAELLSGTGRVNARFDLFDAWIGDTGRRGAIARGQELFNTKTNATGGTCRGCHSVANAGSSFAAIFFNIGVSAGSRRTPDMPLYTLRNLSTGEELQTTDPGRALITGKWADIDRFKAPVLRGVAARPPYFHNGSAASLDDVIAHYESALGFDFTGAEQADLVLFLAAL